MSKNIELDKTGKMMALCMIASALLEEAGKHLKTDNSIYKQRNKHLINSFLNANIPVIEARRLIANLITSPEVLKDSSDVLGYSLDAETVIENFTDEQNLLSNLISLYINIRSDSEMSDLLTYTENLRKDKRLYTREDLLWKLKCATKDFCNYKVDEERLKKYL